MTGARNRDALAHVKAAIAALTYDEHVRIDSLTHKEIRIDPVESSIGQDLHEISAKIALLSASGGRRQPTVLTAIGDAITEALVELIAAENALEGTRARHEP